MNQTTQVLIVGAGPTGLMAANQLARFGVDFIIVDKKSGPTIESRAIAVTARSLEIYQQMRIAKEAIEGGKIIKSFNLYSGGKLRAEVIIGEIEIKYNETIIKIRAKYLIACDGAKSLVRHQLDFSFRGGTYKHKFFVADTRISWNIEYDKLIIAPGNLIFCAFLPLYGDQQYRVLGTLPEGFYDTRDVTFNDIKNVVVDTLGVKLEFKSINWFSIYKLHHRGVNHFRKGNVFLAGDSAHIHSPAGGQGMNTGLQDSYNLCWKLALVLNNHAHPSLLDTYNEERLPFAKWLLQFTDRGFNIMTSNNWFIKLFRNLLVIRIAGKVLAFAPIRKFAFKIISQTGYSYRGGSLNRNRSKQKLKFNTGERLPYLPGENIYPPLNNASFHLLHIHSKPLSEENTSRIQSSLPFAICIIEIQLTEGWKKLGVKKELFIIVRPDNYIAYINDAYEENDLGDFLSKYFKL